MNSKTEFATTEKLLELDPITKPKGICLIPGCTDGFLALLGKPKPAVFNMATFPPSAVYEQYDVSLRCFSAVLNEDNKKFEDKFDQHQSTVEDGGHAVCTVVTNSEHSPSLLRLPDGRVFNGCVAAMGSDKTSLISEQEFNELPELLGHSKESFQGKKHTQTDKQYISYGLVSSTVFYH